jgi:alpha-beta hydrolase superfamily lysophospholipase
MSKMKNGLLNFALSLALLTGYAAAAAFATIDTHGQPPLDAWVPAAKPKLAILCVHGLGLHAGSFAEFGERLKQDGVAVYAIDARGFGHYWQRGDGKIDFDGTMQDIGNISDLIAKENPGVPLFILGESMGGAIALQAASKYQDRFAGLICAVPSGDRFGDLNVDLHLGVKVLTKGFGERFNAGDAVIANATKKHDDKNGTLDAKTAAHRLKWSQDPLGRKDYSIGELLTFQNFMSKNTGSAQALRKMPVLFVQGAHDNLVRPSGTWDVWEYLQTPNRDKVISESSEHLIFENGQFSENDLKFVTDWIGRATAPKVALAAEPLKIDAASNAPSVIKASSNLTYWIELKRDGKTFRCNNKTQFKSGDEIRFHMRAGVDGYAYILLQQGSGGARAVLFPEQRTGTNNVIASGKDCAIPTMTYLKFDDQPGVEKVNLIFSQHPMDVNHVLHDPNTVTAYVSPDKSGSKDLVPTRMQLSWDDTNPVLIPNVQPDTALASTSSMVRVASADDTVSLDIALEHK